MTLFYESLMLVGSFLLVFILGLSGLLDQDVPLIGLLMLVYLLTSLRKKASPDKTGTMTLRNSLNLFSLLTLLLVIIQITGGINSLLFYGLILFSFALAFIFSPETVFIFGICTGMFFLSQALSANTAQNLAKLASFLALCPIAYFFGKAQGQRYRERTSLLGLTGNTSDKAAIISRELSEVLEREKAVMNLKDQEELKAAIAEANSLTDAAEIQ